MNVLQIAAGKIAFCEAAIINSIQQVGFANSVFSTNTNDAAGKLKRVLAVVLKLEQRYRIKSKQNGYLLNCKICKKHACG
jgi:hypothetical protein